MKLKKTLSFWDVFSIALGQVIGSGIMVLIGIGIEFTAYAVPFAFMGSAMPATGGLYVYCKRVLGDKIGFFFLALLLITHILIALFALGFANYVAALIPALEENIKFVALGILVVFL